VAARFPVQFLMSRRALHHLRVATGSPFQELWGFIAPFLRPYSPKCAFAAIVSIPVTFPSAYRLLRIAANRSATIPSSPVCNASNGNAECPERPKIQGIIDAASDETMRAPSLVYFSRFVSSRPTNRGTLCQLPVRNIRGHSLLRIELAAPSRSRNKLELSVQKHLKTVDSRTISLSNPGGSITFSERPATRVSETCEGGSPDTRPPSPHFASPDRLVGRLVPPVEEGVFGNTGPLSLAPVS